MVLLNQGTGPRQAYVARHSALSAHRVGYQRLTGTNAPPLTLNLTRTTSRFRPEVLLWTS